MTLLLLGCLWLAQSFSGLEVLGGSSQLGLIFTQVHGLRAGDPVTIGGVQAGRVVDIEFASADIQEGLLPLTGGIPLVQANVELDGRSVPKESTYTVMTDLNGRRWLDITVSPGEETIGPNEVFFAESSASQDDQLQRTLRTFTQLSSETKEVRELLADPDFRLQTRDAASNLRFYSRELAGASARAPEQLEAFERQLDQQEALLYARLADFSENTAQISARMREMTPQLTESLEGWRNRMERQGERLSAALQMAVVRSDEYRDLADRAIERGLNEESLERLTIELRSWSRRIEEYRLVAEDVHTITSDPQVQDELKALIGNMYERSAQLRARIAALEALAAANPWLRLDSADSPTSTVPREGEQSGESPSSAPQSESDGDGSSPGTEPGGVAP